MVAFVYKESREGCLGSRQRGKRREWLTADAWKAIDIRRPLKKKLIGAKSKRQREHYQQQYSRRDRGRPTG